MKDPKYLGYFIREHLSDEVKKIKELDTQLSKIFRKSWEQPAYFTQEDWDEAKKLVKKLNRLCVSKEDYVCYFTTSHKKSSPF